MGHTEGFKRPEEIIAETEKAKKAAAEKQVPLELLAQAQQKDAEKKNEKVGNKNEKIHYDEWREQL